MYMYFRMVRDSSGITIYTYIAGNCLVDNPGVESTFFEFTFESTVPRRTFQAAKNEFGRSNNGENTDIWSNPSAYSECQIVIECPWKREKPKNSQYIYYTVVVVIPVSGSFIIYDSDKYTEKHWPVFYRVNSFWIRRYNNDV